MKKESDPASQERLESVEREVVELRASTDSMKGRWDIEKDLISAVRSAKERRESLTAEYDRAERAGDLERAA